VSGIRSTSRDTMGVSLMDVSGDSTIVAVARGEASDDDDVEAVAEGDVVDGSHDPSDDVDGSGSVTVIADDPAADLAVEPGAEG